MIKNRCLLSVLCGAVLSWMSLPARADLNVTGVLPPPSPWGDLSINPQTNFLYISTENEIRVLDGRTHQLLHSVPMNGAAEVEADPTRNRIYARNTRLTLIDGRTHAVVNSVPLEDPDHKRDMVYSPLSNYVYIADIGCISRPDCLSFLAVYHGDTLQHFEWVTVKRFPQQIVIDPELNRVYVRYAEENVITVISGLTVIGEIPLEAAPMTMAVDPTTHTLYVLEKNGTHLTVIDGRRNAVTGRYRLTGNFEMVYRMAVNPQTGDVAFARRDARDTPGDFVGHRDEFHSLLLWKGAVSPDGRLEFAQRKELRRSLWGLWIAPTTERIYARHLGDDGGKLLVIEDAPPTDVHPPTVTVTLQREPNAAGWFTAPVPLTVRATDNPGGLGVDLITLTWNPSEPPPTMLHKTGYGDQLEALLDNASASYRVRDVAGNELHGSISLRIDDDPPQTAAALSGAPGGLTQVTLSATDPGAPDSSGAAGTWYNVDGGPFARYTGPFTLSPERSHIVRYYSRDIAGNGEAEKILEVYRSGDVNNDAQVEIGDVIRILQIVVGGGSPTPQQLGAGDQDGSGALDVADAVRLLRRIVGL